MKLTTIHNIFKRAIPLQTLLRSSLSFSVKSFFMLSSFGSKYLQHFVYIFITKYCFTSAICNYKRLHPLFHKLSPKLAFFFIHLYSCSSKWVVFNPCPWRFFIFNTISLCSLDKTNVISITIFKVYQNSKYFILCYTIGKYSVIKCLKIGEHKSKLKCFLLTKMFFG